MVRTYKSKKKARMLVILIAFTAILTIITTYAWFSIQKDVEVTGLNVKVEVADNMQISLNGSEWFQFINITDMNQLLGTSTQNGVHQADTNNNNYVPTRLEPVSTVGTISSGRLLFKKGIINGVKLENIGDCSETTLSADTNTQHPYLVFDLYVKNLSSKTDLQNLQLNAGSAVWAELNGVGLAESVRVGFIAHNTNTVALTSTGEEVRAGTSGGADDLVAIWEPNYLKHTSDVVANDPRINSKSEAYTTYCVKDTAGTSINDITSESDATNLATVKTNQVPQSLFGVHEVTAETADLNTVTSGTLKIKPNVITKVRIYMWLEGQDPDCVSVASIGKMVNANIKLTKGNGDTDIKYDNFAIGYTRINSSQFQFYAMDHPEIIIDKLYVFNDEGQVEVEGNTLILGMNVFSGGFVQAEAEQDGVRYRSQMIKWDV